MVIRKTFDDYKDKTISELKNVSIDDQHKIVQDYIKVKKISDSATSDFYACISQLEQTKSGKLPLKEIMGWCQTDYDNYPDKFSEKYTNFDTFLSNFSGWSGVYRPLEDAIKASMNDEDSYKHKKTVYRLVMDQHPHAFVTETFSGKNGYGAVVTGRVTVSVDIKTGNIIQIIQ